jgi:hypothetical protein
LHALCVQSAITTFLELVMHRRLFSLSVVTSLLAASSAAQALGSLTDVDVIDRRTGQVLPLHSHKGEYWVAGRPGARYAIRVRNQTGQRVLAVMSVDGVNILTGQTAALEQSGYVLAPWQQADIKGWRKSDAQVAAFEFTASQNSYAERTGRPADVGVIGVALFREQPPVVYKKPAPIYREQGPGLDQGRSRYESEGDSASKPTPAAPAAPSAAPSPEPTAEAHSGSTAQSASKERSEPQASSRHEPSPKLGTGHGARETSYTRSTTFERMTSHPQEVIRIRYDSRERLVAMGVIREWTPPPHLPNPFPDSPVSQGYVPDPPRR